MDSSCYEIFLYSVFRSWDQPVPNYSVDTNVNSWLCSLVNTAALDFLHWAANQKERKKKKTQNTSVGGSPDTPMAETARGQLDSPFQTYHPQIGFQGGSWFLKIGQIVLKWTFGVPWFLDGWFLNEVFECPGQETLVHYGFGIWPAHRLKQDQAPF